MLCSKIMIDNFMMTHPYGVVYIPSSYDYISSSSPYLSSMVHMEKMLTLLSIFPFLFTAASSSNCAHVVGQGLLEDTSGIDLYVDASNSKQPPSHQIDLYVYSFSIKSFGS